MANIKSVQMPEHYLNFIENKDDILISVAMQSAKAAILSMARYENLIWENQQTNLPSAMTSAVFKVIPGTYPYFCANISGSKPKWGNLKIIGDSDE